MRIDRASDGFDAPQYQPFERLRSGSGCLQGMHGAAVQQSDGVLRMDQFSTISRDSYDVGPLSFYRPQVLMCHRRPWAEL